MTAAAEETYAVLEGTTATSEATDGTPRLDQIDDLDDFLSSREDKLVISRKNERDNFFDDWIERYM